MSTHNMFLWRTEENHPLIIIKYPSYLFHFRGLKECEDLSRFKYLRCLWLNGNKVIWQALTNQIPSDIF